MDQKLRIGVIGIEEPEAGGAHSAETQMAARLGRLKEECELVYFSTGRSGLISQFIGNKFRFLGQFSSLLFNNPASWVLTRRFKLLPYSRFERRILREDIDLVFFVGQYDLAAKLRQTPYIVTIWDLGHRDLPELPEMSSNREFEYREWRIQNIAKKATYVIVDSEVTKSNLILLYGLKSERIVSIPFVTKIQNSQKAEERESFAFYPAHFWSHKNHSILLYSIQNLLEQNIKPRKLVLTGLDKGSKPFIDKLVRELEIQDYVKYIGFVSRSELEELYKKAAVTVMPSLLGPTNLPPLESLSQGCPVVVSENGSTNLDKYDSVIVLNPLDLEAWSNVMSMEFIFQPVDRDRFNEIQASLEEENLDKVLQIVQNCKKIARTYK
jgi:glycosyltransferase involved in cell wall biosynthesis